MNKFKKFSLGIAVSLAGSLTFAFATPVQAMHIMEGFLPADWAAFWWAMFLPFFILGVRSIRRITR
ncbi:MAG: energy-coupling factor ABC transporter permease, partial [Cyanobacteria bacterium SBC]|nr:energy-coupling factor ABC transporter permease [Cyanobacteria bacterium SBC]